MDLTGKKRAFVDAVLAGKSNKEAAVLAGYSAKTASAAGSRLAKDKEVVAYLKARIADMARVDDQVDDDAPPAPSPSDHRLSPAVPIVWTDPLAFLRVVMNHEHTDLKHRINAAKAMLPYELAKKSDIGKKEEREQFSLIAEQGSDWAGLLQ